MQHGLSDSDVLSLDPPSAIGPAANLTVVQAPDDIAPTSAPWNSRRGNKGAPRIKVPAPLLQGQLDSLCGVYALINAVRLLLGNPSRSIADALFNQLIDEIDAGHGINHTIHEGIAFDTELKLARIAVDSVASKHRNPITVRPLIDGRKRPPLSMVTAEVAEVIDTGGVVVAAFMGRLNHWSVIRQFTPLHLGLYDSSGLMRVRIDRCRMTYEPSRTTGDHVIDLKGLFVLTPPDHEPGRSDKPPG